MDLKQSERYYHGYIFMPCCTEDHSYFHNQLQGYQAMSSSYPSPVSKCDAIFRTQSEHQATYTSRFTSHSGDHRLFFPATQRERQPQRCEVSRHKISVESLPERPLLRDFRQRRSWKMEPGCKRKRNRTIFTTDQLERLETEFDRQQYIVGTQRFYLAADLGLNETQVKVWFQNRRIKWRRQNLSNVGSSERSRLDSNEVENVQF